MIRKKSNKIVLLFLLLICYYREIEGNGGEDERGGGKIKGSKSEVEGGKLKVGEGKGGELEQGGVELGGIRGEIKSGKEGQIEAKGGERVPEQFIKKSDKETKSLKKVWGKIENKKEETGDEKEYKNDFPSLLDSKNVTKKSMRFKYLSAKKDSPTPNKSDGELDCKEKCLEGSPQHIKDEKDGIEESELNELKCGNLVSTSEVLQKSSGEENIDTKNEEYGKDSSSPTHSDGELCEEKRSENSPQIIQNEGEDSQVIKNEEEEEAKLNLTNLFASEPSETSSDYEDESVVLNEENNEEKLKDEKGKGKIGEVQWRRKNQQLIESEVKKPEHTESKLQPSRSSRRNARRRTLEGHLIRIARGRRKIYII